MDVASQSLEARIGQQGAADSFPNNPEGRVMDGADDDSSDDSRKRQKLAQLRAGYVADHAALHTYRWTSL